MPTSKIICMSTIHRPNWKRTQMSFLTLFFWSTSHSSLASAKSPFGFWFGYSRPSALQFCFLMSNPKVKFISQNKPQFRDSWNMSFLQNDNFRFDFLVRYFRMVPCSIWNQSNLFPIRRLQGKNQKLVDFLNQKHSENLKTLVCIRGLVSYHLQTQVLIQLIFNCVLLIFCDWNFIDAFRLFFFVNIVEIFLFSLKYSVILVQYNANVLILRELQGQSMSIVDLIRLMMLCISNI